MSTDLKENPSTNITHNDKDLVQLAGYHAYKKYEKNDEIQVNGKVFLVINVINDSATGLDALTVRNTTVYDKNGNLSEERNYDGELVIVYVGSDQVLGDWINTNINLIGDTEPAQLEAANAYFDEMEQAFGKISSVTGNFLAS
jgi:YD repeat-containing protein